MIGAGTEGARRQGAVIGCLSRKREVAPYLRGGGQGQQVMLEGNRLVLTCLAGGSWPLQYRWTLNSSNITDWTPQYRLSLPSLKRTDAGLYQCMVRNRMGAVIHRRTEVQVAFLGNFSTEEQRKTVTQGRAAIISPPPLASFPRPLVTWFKDGQKIIPNNRIRLLNQAKGAGLRYTAQAMPPPTMTVGLMKPNLP
ncbi:protein sidekick-1, partial [Lates japonicus]